MAELQVADEISAESHRQVGLDSAGIAHVLERARVGGPVQHVPLSFVLTLTNALAEAAIDEMIRDPDRASATAPRCNSLATTPLCSWAATPADSK